VEAVAGNDSTLKTLETFRGCESRGFRIQMRGIGPVSADDLGELCWVLRVSWGYENGGGISWGYVNGGGKENKGNGGG
jgi:hypothetical protein